MSSWSKKQVTNLMGDHGSQDHGYCVVRAIDPWDSHDIAVVNSCKKGRDRKPEHTVTEGISVA